MTKHLHLLVLLCLVCLSSRAQLGMTVTDTTVCKTTTFSVCATPPASTLPNIDMDDKFSSAISIGFPFTFYGQTFTQLVISDNNFISFNTGLAGQVSLFKYQDALNAGQLDNAIMFPFQDLNPSNSNGIIRYKTVGTAPNRRFIIEYCNVGYYSCNGISATDQLVLVEGSNNIEMHIAQKLECAVWPIGTSVGKGVQGVRGTSNATAVFASGRGPASATWTATAEGMRFTPSGSTGYSVSNISYNQEPFFNPGGTFAWYAENSNTSFAATNCVSITTNPAVNYYVAVYTGTIGCNSNVPMTAQDTVFVHHNNITATKTLSYCQSALPVTWNGMTIPAGTTSQNNYDTVLVSGGTCDTSFIVNLNITPAVTPTFTQVDTICSGATLSPLPATSLNGIAGTWSPALNNTATTTYTFTPGTGICAVPVTMTIAVKQNIQPFFGQIPPQCIGTVMPPLPTTDIYNNITGYWTPSTINNMASGTYIFHPTSVQCGLLNEMFIQINNNTVPTFHQYDPICIGSTITPLPTMSLNQIHGSWSPALNNNATTTYTFTPDTGQCAVPTTMTVQVLPILEPVFSQVPPVCINGVLMPLPTTSQNGFTGTWSPAPNSGATTTYTFTPNPGQCADTATMTIQVLPNTITPVFNAIAPVCYGSATNPLPPTSTNGINGGWSPAWNNTATTTYTFISEPGQCALNTTMTVAVNSVVPTFTPIAAVCYGAANPLPATSTNGISGTWSPAWNNAATTTYTFTPNPGQCATGNVSLTVTVNNSAPVFTQVGPICQGATVAPLPTTSNNGISGTWSPALNNNATTTYTFTPTAGQCASGTTMTIVVNSAAPLFTQVPAICAGAALAPLPTTSSNGISGTWSPALNNNATTTYTFTPAAGQCATTATMTITVNPVVVPQFNQEPSVCLGNKINPIPTTSLNGVQGNWSPAANSNVTTTYTFTPNPGQCATTATMTIVVNPIVNPVFTQVSPICAGAALAPLPATSSNGITGSWSPAINNNATTTYTFIPDTTQCANPTQMTITVNPPVAPAFTPVNAICAGAALAPLPTTSTNGITGTWAPALNNTATTTYTFTPAAGQCATNATMTIAVNNNTAPTFTAVAPICAGAALSPLPTTSSNNITGTWSPALNNNATTTYTFTPAAGQCANTTTMTITVNPVIAPAFTPVATICAGAALSALPTTSTNGVSGTWSPALNNNTTTTYTFTPAAGQCASTATMTITVNPNVIPAFTPVNAICAGAALSPLPTTSTNGVTGTWAPALNNTATTTYTFTPAAGQCATNATMTIAVNNNTAPTFTAVAPICAGAALSPLPTTSSNNITGTWSPALNNTATTTYTFTPAAGQCANTTTMTITVNPVIAPAFTPVATICAGAALSALPTTSTNGVSGTWSPALNNNATTTYTFTPSAGQCATTATMTITVNPSLTPAFTPVNAICAGATLSPLPTTSTNGVSGTWSPALNNTATTTYTFTPAAGQCATSTTMTIAVNNNTTPSFTLVAPVCAGATLSPLPTTSSNNITGTWSPVLNNTATTTYTFTPTAGQCAVTTTMTITVNPIVTPAFTAVGPVCAGTPLSALPATSLNSINGSWSPAINNMATTTYTFTPATGQCATSTTMTIVITPSSTPAFVQVNPICSGAALSALPTTSTNGISGNWSPAINNTTTTTYTFTPAPGQCALPVNMTITVNPNVVPVFTPLGPICAGTPISPLATTSANGVTGTWSPAINNMATTTYTFTPAGNGQCAAGTTMTIVVNPYLTGTRTVSICEGDSYTFNGLVYTAPVNGVKDTIPNQNACDSIITLNLNINPKTYGIQAATVCQGTVYTFNGVAYTTANNTAKDTLVNSHGCDSIVTLNLTVVPVNPISATYNLNGCGTVYFNGQPYTNDAVVHDTLHTQLGCDSLYRTTQITVYPEYHYGQTIDTIACGKLVYNGVTYTESVTIKDSLQTIHGCDSLINNINIQIINFELSATVTPENPYVGEEVHIQTSSNGMPYSILSWSPLSFFADQQALSQTFTATTDQHVIITGAGPGGCTDTAVVDFKVRPYEPEIMIPNAFTPNGDGRNDVFVPVLSIDRGYQLSDFRIFNRWGQLLFSTAQVNVGWDGTYKGALQSQDVYFYTVTVILRDGTRKFYKGDITLLR